VDQAAFIGARDNVHRQLDFSSARDRDIHETFR
jgi:hypothetical protein